MTMKERLEASLHVEKPKSGFLPDWSMRQRHFNMSFDLLVQL
jgi:hypothetical protein